LRSIKLTSRSKTMRVSFSPDLDLGAVAPSSVAFQIDENGHNKLVYGNVSVERRGGAIEMRWQPRAPDWAKSHVLITTVTLNEAGYKLEVR
jgi:hypothetical protein